MSAFAEAATISLTQLEVDDGTTIRGEPLVLGASVFVFEVAGRLACLQLRGWGWFLFVGIMLAVLAHDLWTEESPKPRSTPYQKPYSSHHHKKPYTSHDLE